MPMIRVRDLLIGLGVYAVLDVTAAQILKHTLSAWTPTSEERRYRTASPYYHHGLVPNVTAIGQWGPVTFPVATNSLGFRDRAVRTVIPEADTARVIFIGDSYTEGIGVPYEETYVGILDQALGRQGIQVLNAAVASYSPSIYYRKLKYLLNGVHLQCRFVVVAIDLSDVADEAEVYRLDSTGSVVDRQGVAQRQWREVLKDNSLLFRVGDVVKDLLRDRVFQADRWQTGTLDRRSDWTVDPGAYEGYGREGLQLAAASMDQLVLLLRRQQIGMAVVVYPWPTQILAGDQESIQVRYWRAWARRQGLPFFNLFPAFFADTDPRAEISRYFIPHDAHWSSAGHRFVARLLMAQGLGDTIATHLTTNRPPQLP